MSSLQHKILAWILWIISAAGAAYMAATGFSFLILWGIINIAFVALLLWVGGARTKIEEEIRNERSAKEPRRD